MAPRITASRRLQNESRPPPTPRPTSVGPNTCPAPRLTLSRGGRRWWTSFRSIFQSGGVFYGGLLAGILVAWWYARRYQLPLWRTADVLAPGVVIGQAIGRLGCFMNGCCYGHPTAVPWGVKFPHDSFAWLEFGVPGVRSKSSALWRIPRVWRPSSTA